MKTINKGRIELIVGPMFSGKSTELLRIIRRYKVKNLNPLIVKYDKDNRYNSQNKIITHDKIEYEAIHINLLKKIKTLLQTKDVIGIDDGQFFPDLKDVCEDLANEGKSIVISALNSNYKREGFKSILEIIPKCDKILNLQAICYYCKDDASFTLRTSKDKEEILIGGIDYYRPCCRECYMVHNQDKDKVQIEKVVESIKRKML